MTMTPPTPDFRATRRLARLAAWPLALAAALAPATAPAVDGDWAVIAYINPELPFNAREVPLHPAPGGLALTVVNGLWNLVPATLSAKVTDRDGKGRPQAVAITAAPAGALAYLRLPGMSEGKVDTPDLRFKDNERDLESAPVALPFKGTTLRFEPRDKAVWLTDGTRRQKIADIEQRPDGVSPDDWAHGDALLWAGDLDRDGKLDVITALTGDDGATMCVWLSSKAAAGQLVGKAACMDHAY